MINLLRTDSTHPDFVALVRELDADLAERDGTEHAFYAQYNAIQALQHVVVAYLDTVPVGCGAFKPFEAGKVEIKRMYTVPSNRKHGIAAQVLGALEAWAIELGVQACVLETGKKQPEAIGLYSKSGYVLVPNYGQYVGVENSVCFEKVLVKR